MASTKTEPDNTVVHLQELQLERIYYFLWHSSLYANPCHFYFTFCCNPKELFSLLILNIKLLL